MISLQSSPKEAVRGEKTSLWLKTDSVLEKKQLLSWHWFASGWFGVILRLCLVSLLNFLIACSGRGKSYLFAPMRQEDYQVERTPKDESLETRNIIRWFFLSQNIRHQVKVSQFQEMLKHDSLHIFFVL